VSAEKPMVPFFLLAVPSLPGGASFDVRVQLAKARDKTINAIPERRDTMGFSGEVGTVAGVCNQTPDVLCLNRTNGDFRGLTGFGLPTSPTIVVVYFVPTNRDIVVQSVSKR
jgi:hypothetical protein